MMIDEVYFHNLNVLLLSPIYGLIFLYATSIWT